MSSEEDFDRRMPRFEAMLVSTAREKAIGLASDLDLDRLPDADGKVRLLLTPADAQRVLERGYRLQLLAAVPSGPLDSKLVMDDTDAQRALEAQLDRLPRRRGR